MERIKVVSLLAFFVLILLSIINILEYIFDLNANQFFFINMYYEDLIEREIPIRLTSELLDASEFKNKLIIHGILFFPLLFEVFVFFLLGKLFLSFYRGQIYIKKNFNLIVLIIGLFVLKSLLLPISDILYVSTVNDVLNLHYEIENFFIINKLEDLLTICILSIVSWTFFESLNLKTKSDEFEMQKQFLIQQHKLSQLGKLLGFITHEWKEPLNRISSYIVSMQMKNKDDQISSKLEQCQHQIDHMVNTMGNFKSFYLVESTENHFYFTKAIDYILKLSKDDLLMNNIEVTYKNNNTNKVIGNESEFSQVLLILLNNSKEAFVLKNITKREITIEITNNTIIYKDTAGGMKESELEKMFLPEFTTKKENMGIGLYMARLILEEKFHSTIKATNTKNGLCFTIELTNV